MNRLRLQKLVDHLQTVPEESFNMNLWWRRFAGCAAGHACQIPEFNEAGLSLSELTSTMIRFPIYKIPGEPPFNMYLALVRFFDIDRSSAFLIFDPRTYAISYPKIKDVIKRIEEVLNVESLSPDAIVKRGSKN